MCRLYWDQYKRHCFAVTIEPTILLPMALPSAVVRAYRCGVIVKANTYHLRRVVNKDGSSAMGVRNNMVLGRRCFNAWPRGLLPRGTAW